MRYIGLDLALATVHKAVVIDEQGQDVTPVLSVETSALSLEQLLHRAREGARSDEPLVVVMEPRHKEEVLGLAPEAGGKVFLLKELGNPPQRGAISDPIGGTLEDYRACQDEIARCLDGVAAKMKGMSKT